jgi:hypothetical protein
MGKFFFYSDFRFFAICCLQVTIPKRLKKAGFELNDDLLKTTI